MLPRFAHQEQSIDWMRGKEEVFDASDPGCVSADTEYLTPIGWKRMDAYTAGDKVAQFYPGSREIEFVFPMAYVKKPCTEFISIAPVRGTSQRLSREHRVLFYRPEGTWGESSAEEFALELETFGANKLRKKFCSTFSVRSTSFLELSDEQIRIMVAVIADGHFPCGTRRCAVRLKKQRKKDRLEALLIAASVAYDKVLCNSAAGFHTYRFQAPRREKEFSAYWWGASQHQLEIIADELPHWDSSISVRPSGGIRFSSFIRASAEFAQYAFSAAKHPASLNFAMRDRTAEGRGVMIEHYVHAQRADAMFGPGRKTSVSVAPNEEGFKYCFEVPTSFLLLRHNGYIFATGNTGKSRVQVELIRERAKTDNRAALIIAPKSLLRSTWREEFRKYAPELIVSCAYAENRDKAFADPADVYVTNTDATTWLAKQPAKFFRRFSTLVVDESGSFKHATSQRSRALRKIVPAFEFRTNLNGTVNPNTILDVWHQYFLLDQGKRLGKSFYAFRNIMCRPTQVGPMPNMVKWEDREGAEGAVAGLVRDITIRHVFEDCLDIPPNHEYSVNFVLSPKHRKAYEQMKLMALASLDTGTITAVNAAAVATKLLQIASGAVYESEHLYHSVDESRNELIMDLLEERKHSLVFFQWRHQKDQIIAALNKRGFTYCVLDGETSDNQKTENIRLFEQGFYKVCIAQPQSAAHGLTLIKATSTIWASPTYNTEFFIQGNRRVYRAGQTQKTETIVVIAENTIDELVYAKMAAKRIRMLDLLAELK